MGTETRKRSIDVKWRIDQKIQEIAKEKKKPYQTIVNDLLIEGLRQDLDFDHNEFQKMKFELEGYIDKKNKEMREYICLMRDDLKVSYLVYIRDVVFEIYKLSFVTRGLVRAFGIKMLMVMNSVDESQKFSGFAEELLQEATKRIKKFYPPENS